MSLSTPNRTSFDGLHAPAVSAFAALLNFLELDVFSVNKTQTSGPDALWLSKRRLGSEDSVFLSTLGQ